MTQTVCHAPATLPELLTLLEQRGPGLSPQFRRIAGYLAANPDEVALAPLRVLAGHVSAHPSALVRLAKALGYEGFREMQRVFKAAVFDRAKGVTSRTSMLHRALAPRGRGADAARAVVAHEMAGLQTLLERLSSEALQAASARLAAARLVWLGADGAGGAVAGHLRWLLSRRKPVLLLEGGTGHPQLGGAEEGDVAVLMAMDLWPDGAVFAEEARRSGCEVLLVGRWDTVPEGMLHFPLPPPAAGQPLALSPGLALATILAAPPLASAEAMPFADFDPLGW